MSHRHMTCQILFLHHKHEKAYSFLYSLSFISLNSFLSWHAQRVYQNLVFSEITTWKLSTDVLFSINSTIQTAFNFVKCQLPNYIITPHQCGIVQKNPIVLFRMMPEQYSVGTRKTPDESGRSINLLTHIGGLLWSLFVVGHRYLE